MTRDPYCPDCNDTHARTTLDRDRLLDYLREVEDYLEKREDIVDGPDGRPAPSVEMNLLRETRVCIHSIELVQALDEKRERALDAEDRNDDERADAERGL